MHADLKDPWYSKDGHPRCVYEVLPAVATPHLHRPGCGMVLLHKRVSVCRLTVVLYQDTVV